MNDKDRMLELNKILNPEDLEDEEMVDEFIDVPDRERIEKKEQQRRDKFREKHRKERDAEMEKAAKEKAEKVKKFSEKERKDRAREDSNKRKRGY